MAPRSVAILFASFLFAIATAEECAEIPMECDLPDLPAQQPWKRRADVVYVMDGSNSIGEKSFILGKNFIADYISGFNIEPEATRVGVITFSTNATVNLQLQESGKIGLDRAVNIIKAIQLPGGGTRAGQGIEALTMLFQTQGRLKEPEVQSVGFIFTDGRSQEPPGEYARTARALGIELYAIGIGDEINEEELLSIAGDKKRVFLLENFEQLSRDVFFPSFPSFPVPPKPARGIVCVQLECMLDDEGVPTMRVFVPESLDACCTGRIGSCDRITYEASGRIGFVKKDLKAGECNTKFNVASEDLEYTNILHLYKHSDGGTIVRDETEWHLKCKYPRNQLKTVMFKILRQVYNVTKNGVIPMKLEIFDANYVQLLPIPSVFKLKERVHVQASMVTHDELTLFPLKCWANDGADPTGKPMKTLIVNGCDVEATLMREQETTPVHSRFSFNAFRFKDVGSCKVYVHCDLLICAANDPNSRCSQGCLPGTVRRRRSTSEGSVISTQSVTVGPILVGDTQHDSKTEIDGVSRMERLQQVGKRLSQMMLNMRRGRRAFRERF